ncbi:MAG: hypothetical protein LBS53_04170 [Synergistaceae bacterium]|jgi:hypothetical protein|nr:hypothetical protein [Synergistaceae bacterium]
MKYRFSLSLLLVLVLASYAAAEKQQGGTTLGGDLGAIFELKEASAAETQKTAEPLEETKESSSVVVQKENGLIDWTKNYIEAKGMAVAPTGTKGAQAKALARRGAIVDLQRNLLEFIVGVQVDARTTMNDFMASDRVRTEINGMIKNVELLEGEWDEESYNITGRVKLPEVLIVVAPELKTPAAKPAVSPPKTSGKYTGLVIDARHLPVVPTLSFYVVDESGREVYGVNFADQKFLAQSGLCTYYNNFNYAKGEIRVATNPITAKAIRLGSDNVAIVIPNSAAAKVRGSSYDFRGECKVIICVK